MVLRHDVATEMNPLASAADMTVAVMEQRRKDREADIHRALTYRPIRRYRQGPVPITDVEMTPIARDFSLEHELPWLWATLTEVERARLKRTRFIWGAMAEAIAPNPPQAFVSSLPSDTATGTTVTVKTSGGDYTSLQAAMNFIVTLNQNLNHVIQIDAGFVNTGTVIAPPKTGTGWVMVRSSEWASLSAGTRVGASNVHMATLQPPLNSIEVCLHIPDGSNGWRFIGIEFKVQDEKNLYANHTSPTYEVVRVGGNNSMANRWHSPSGPAITERVSFERCWGHGLQFSQTGKILSLNSKDTQVWDSRWEEAHRGIVPGGDAEAQECQAIFLGDGAGPFHIENNFCSAAGQGILFYMKDNSADWAGMAVDECVPSDAIIRRNHVFNPTRWMNQIDAPFQKGTDWDGSRWVVKQLVEFKSGRRILAEGNLLENLWASQGQLGQTPGFVGFYTSDIRWQYNKMLNTNSGVYFASANATSAPQWLGTNIHSGNDSHSFPGTAMIRERIAVLHNLFVVDNPAIVPSGRFGFFLQYTIAFVNGAYDQGVFNDIWAEHNTVVAGNVGDGTEAGAWAYSNPPDQVGQRSTIRNNIFPYNKYGPNSAGHSVPGGQTDANKGFDSIFGVDRVFGRNVMWGSTFGQGDWNPVAFSLVGTLASAGINADGTLAPGSPCKAGGAFAATDATDNGVNFAALLPALVGTVDTTAPTVPSNLDHDTPVGPTSFTLTWDASTDAVGVLRYDIEITNVDLGAVVAMFTSTTTSKLITGLATDTEYSARVRALDTSLNPSAYSSSHSVTTAPDNAVRPDVMRGFGPTRGFGATDHIDLPLVTQAAQRSTAIWLRIDAGGGGGYPVVWQKGSAPGYVDTLVYEISTNQMLYVRAFSGGLGAWRFPAPVAGVPALLVLKHDTGSAVNLPILKINDQVQPLLSSIPTTGTASTNASPYTLGNSPASYGQVWSGDLAQFMVYDFLTTDAEDTDLYEGTDPETIGAGPVAYHPLAGEADEPDMVTDDTSVLVGTKVQIYQAATLSITALAVTAGDPATGDYQVTATVAGGTPNRVEFWVDGALLRSDTSAPFTLFAADDALGAGPHVIEARVFAGAGGVADYTLSLNVVEPSPVGTNFWAISVTWDRLEGATGYNVYLDGVFATHVVQPQTGQPVYNFTKPGLDITIVYDIAATYAPNIEGPKLRVRRRYNGAVQMPTGFQELFKGHTT